MAKPFKPSTPYTTAAELLKPTYTYKKGVAVKAFPETGERINISFKTYGGTESEVNDVYTIVNTAQVETWYSPDITSECRLRICQTGAEFEIIGQPENIDMRNQFLKFRVRAVEGGA